LYGILNKVPNRRTASQSSGSLTPFQRALATSARAAGLAVQLQTAAILERYYELLRRWNARINLTALPLDLYASETFNRLILEPIAAVRFVQQRSARWYDLGSGGGSPALPMRVLLPRTQLTMVESKGRKAAFLKEAVRTLGLGNVDVLAKRFEDLEAEMNGTADLLTIRAVKVDPVLSSLVARLLAPDGRLLIFQSATEPAPIEGFEVDQTVQLLVSDASSMLVVYRR